MGLYTNVQAMEGAAMNPVDDGGISPDMPVSPEAQDVAAEQVEAEGTVKDVTRAALEDIKNLQAYFSTEGAVVESGSGKEVIIDIQEIFIHLEKDLGTFGDAGNGVDGDYGSTMTRVVTEFQTENDLTVTGKVDMETYQALLSAVNLADGVSAAEATTSDTSLAAEKVAAAQAALRTATQVEESTDVAVARAQRELEVSETAVVSEAADVEAVNARISEKSEEISDVSANIEASRALLTGSEAALAEAEANLTAARLEASGERQDIAAVQAAFDEAEAAYEAKSVALARATADLDEVQTLLEAEQAKINAADVFSIEQGNEAADALGELETARQDLRDLGFTDLTMWSIPDEATALSGRDTAKTVAEQAIAARDAAKTVAEQAIAARDAAKIAAEQAITARDAAKTAVDEAQANYDNSTWAGNKLYSYDDKLEAAIAELEAKEGLVTSTGADLATKEGLVTSTGADLATKENILSAAPLRAELESKRDAYVKESGEARQAEIAFAQVFANADTLRTEIGMQESEIAQSRIELAGLEGGMTTAEGHLETEQQQAADAAAKVAEQAAAILAQRTGTAELAAELAALEASFTALNIERSELFTERNEETSEARAAVEAAEAAGIDLTEAEAAAVAADADLEAAKLQTETAEAEEKETERLEARESAISYWKNILANPPANGDETVAVQEKIAELLGGTAEEILPRFGADGDFGSETISAINKYITGLEGEEFKENLPGLEELGYTLAVGAEFETGDGETIKTQYFDHIQQYFQSQFGILVAYHEIQLFDPQTGETFDVPDGPYVKRTQNVYTRDGSVVRRGEIRERDTAEGLQLKWLNEQFASGNLQATLRNTSNAEKNEGIPPLQRLSASQENPIETTDVLEGANAVDVMYPGTDTITEVIAKLLTQESVRAFFEEKGITPTVENWEEMTKYLYQETSGTKIPLGDNFLIRCGTTIGVLNREVVLSADPEVFFNGEPCGAAHLCPAYIELPPLPVVPPVRITTTEEEPTPEIGRTCTTDEDCRGGRLYKRVRCWDAGTFARNQTIEKDWYYSGESCDTGGGDDDDDTTQEAPETGAVETGNDNVSDSPADGVSTGADTSEQSGDATDGEQSGAVGVLG